jgi:N-acetylglucosaminyldiphosphoundecaprenol N-acetyl-beta-D-mannosaminyltransferase
MKTRTHIGHVPFDRLTRAEALSAIDHLAAAGHGGYIVTPNIDHIVMAQHDHNVRAVYGTAALSLADGQPIVWLSRLFGTPVPERVSGSDLIEPLMAMAAAQRYPVYLFGARPSVSAEASRRLRARYADLSIVGRNTGMWSIDDTTAPEDSPVVRAVHASGARVVVLALGCPKQELWMARHAAALAPAIAIGLGASLDFVAGAVTRAPGWVSAAGLEWLFRLVQEPRRLAHRYLVRDLQILPIVARQFHQLAFRKD